ncbi:hypothetical protein BFN03_04480 [Rhodococcus sp. WMMA185]|nr:hypothetical protein BFN03_04480 [Rhodococcus sp. WMMA185]
MAATTGPYRTGARGRTAVLARRGCFAAPAVAEAGFPHGFRQRSQIVFIRGARRKSTLVSNQFPTFGRGDPRRMPFAKIPRMGFLDRGKWSDDRG